MLQALRRDFYYPSSSSTRVVGDCSKSKCPCTIKWDISDIPVPITQVRYIDLHPEPNRFWIISNEHFSQNRRQTFLVYSWKLLYPGKFQCSSAVLEGMQKHTLSPHNSPLLSYLDSFEGGLPILKHRQTILYHYTTIQEPKNRASSESTARQIPLAFLL